ncbi:MAG TPA: DUF3592 domain-containing protein [Blastocatellia bacterium]|nr:DUF3592 domain-containing protein [Blastocatellia bacterium]
MKRSIRASELLSGGKTNKSGCSNLGCALFALPFFLAGAFIIYLLFAGPALEIYKAQSWAPTPCTVVSSRVVGDETYSVEIVYTYTVAGVQYSSDRYDFINVSTSAYDDKYEAVKRNPTGSAATCYVNPDNPAEAVFSRDFSSDMWFGLFGLPFFLAGVFGFYIAIKNALKGKKDPTSLRAKPASAYPGFETIRYRNPSPTAQQESDYQPPSYEPPSYSDSPFDESSLQPLATEPPPATEPTEIEKVFEKAKPADLGDVKRLVEAAWSSRAAASKAAGPFDRRVLEPAFSPGCKVKTMAVITVVWNAVVLAFGGWRVKGSWNDNFFGLMPNLLFSPFELIGIFLLLVTGYYFLALFNPRPRLILSTMQVRLGEPFNVEWEFNGSTRAVKRFFLYMEGCEMATYRRGTNSSTDKSLFAKISIADRNGAARGNAQVTVPANTMHSFTSENNKIVWSIHLRGDIRVWPDVSESFVIEVLPRRLPRAGE